MKKWILIAGVLILGLMGLGYLKGDKQKREGCKIGGCNGELCVDEDSEQVYSPCIVLPEAECYKKEFSVCERQSDGECGWTQNPEMMECLEKFN